MVIAYLLTGLTVLALLTAPAVVLALVTRRRGMPPSTAWQIRRAARRRRLRLGLRA